MSLLAYGIALGSNLSDRLSLLRAARDALLALPESDPASLRCGGLYETAPDGCPPGSPAFLNTALELRIGLAPPELLAAVQDIERSLGRSRPAPRNAPRTIDIDLLYAGNLQVRLPGLELPHPRLALRGFVLRPLADLRPDLVLAGQNDTVAALLTGLPPAERDLPLLAALW